MTAAAGLPYNPCPLLALPSPFSRLGILSRTNVVFRVSGTSRLVTPPRWSVGFYIDFVERRESFKKRRHVPVLFFRLFPFILVSAGYLGTYVWIAIVQSFLRFCDQCVIRARQRHSFLIISRYLIVRRKYRQNRSEFYVKTIVQENWIFKNRRVSISIAWGLIIEAIFAYVWNIFSLSFYHECDVLITPRLYFSKQPKD